MLIWLGLIVGIWITGLEWYFTGKAYESFIGWLLRAEFLVGLLGHTVDNEIRRENQRFVCLNHE